MVIDEQNDDEKQEEKNQARKKLPIEYCGVDKKTDEGNTKEGIKKEDMPHRLSLSVFPPPEKGRGPLGALRPTKWWACLSFLTDGRQGGLGRGDNVVVIFKNSPIGHHPHLLCKVSSILYTLMVVSTRNL